jgi:hypothetical protein
MCTHQDSYRSRPNHLSSDSFGEAKLKRPALHCSSWRRGRAWRPPKSVLVKGAARSTAEAFVCSTNNGNEPEATATAGDASDRRSSQMQTLMPPVCHRHNQRHLRNFVVGRRIDFPLLIELTGAANTSMPRGVKTAAERLDLTSSSRSAQPAGDCRATPAPPRSVSSPAGWPRD